MVDQWALSPAREAFVKATHCHLFCSDWRKMCSVGVLPGWWRVVRWLPFTVPTGLLPPSHVMYADDVLVFCKGTKRNLQTLMHLFHTYGTASGQLNKCKFYTGKISATKTASIANQLGFSVESLANCISNLLLTGLLQNWLLGRDLFCQ